MEQAGGANRGQDGFPLPQAFVAAPFTATLDGATGVMLPEPRRFVTELVGTVERAGYEVFSAHRREEWGLRLMGPQECVPLDFEGVRAADLFVVLPGEAASGGVHIEIGWASAFGIPAVLLLREGCSYSPLVIGLETISPAWTVWWSTMDDCIEKLVALLAGDEVRQATRLPTASVG